MTILTTIAMLLILVGLIIRLGSMAENAQSSGDKKELEDSINELLPQTQCGDCHYPGCLPYARAIVSRKAGIDKCRPGGQQTINKIARLLGTEAPELAAERVPESAVMVARIDEQSCIGCVKCIRACPVDAIIGAAKQMHGVISSECTGCELCLAPCPVDCISMETVPEKLGEWIWIKPEIPYTGTS